MSECQGCLSYISRACDEKNTSKNKKCPCITCLIKGMCTDPCDEFIATSNYIEEREELFRLMRVAHMKAGVK